MMFCPACDTNLDRVPMDAPCPSCGGIQRSAVASSGAVQLHVRTFPPTIVTELALPDGTRETVVGHPGGRSVSRTASGGDDPTQEFEGRPSQNEENVADALHRLRDTLNSSKGDRVWQEHVGHPTDVAIDGTLRSDDGREMKCQVTRVERGTLQDRGRDRRATSHNATDALATNIVTAVESKLGSADLRMILVLDANVAPAYTDDPRVVEIARATLMERGNLGRWAAIWLVGPTTARTTLVVPITDNRLGGEPTPGLGFTR
jgi:hypothetical protein